jgi:O-acetylserine/cysteine efflux transporter
VIWGVAFTVNKIGLESFTPPQLTALRFLVAGVAVIWLPRPAVSWPALIWIGLTLFAGQFLLQFFGIAHGMPPGLTAFAVQTQALFTVLFAALMLGDRPTGQQVAGMLAALAGLLMIALTLGHGVPATAFILTLASAVSWGVGNVLVKRLKNVDMLPLIAWACLVPPLPALVLSVALDGPSSLVQAIADVSWTSAGAVIYLGLVATVFGYAVWSSLLARYPAGAVAPYALLAPCSGALTSSLVLGERFEPLRLGGMAVMLLGLLIAVFPFGRFGVSRVQKT